MSESTNILTVDVEDWFHILDVPSVPDLSRWAGLPSRVERNFGKLLDLLEEGGARATCFFLGWVAERFPHLVREAVARGHEIASHGYAHRLVYTMTPLEFRADAVRARKLLEDLSGGPVTGYRSAGFSLTAGTPWFADELLAAGYAYDSSAFPARRGHGGLEGTRLDPHRQRRPAGDLVEFPVTVAEVFGRRLCFFGGGYLRLTPWPLVRRMARSVLRAGRPVIFYVHPREIDPGHPRLPMSLARSFKSYVNLRTTEGKIRRILAEFQVGTFADHLADVRSGLEAC